MTKIKALRQWWLGIMAYAGRAAALWIFRKNVCSHRYLFRAPAGTTWWCPGCMHEGTTPDLIGKPMRAFFP